MTAGTYRRRLLRPKSDRVEDSVDDHFSDTLGHPVSTSPGDRWNSSPQGTLEAHRDVSRNLPEMGAGPLTAYKPRTDEGSV